MSRVVQKILVLWLACAPLHAFDNEPSQALPLSEWLTLASNVDAGYRRTQFFEPKYNTAVLQWDSRAEVWFPPFRYKFSWGAYVRAAGIKGSRNDAWQNAWLGGPGVGFQIYPFSTRRFQSRDSRIGKLFGPVRLFGEYNFANYWGKTNEWRPHRQTRAGLEYWSASNINSTNSRWWREIWTGLYWQSSNDFANTYDTTIFANAGRVGVRKPHSGAVSTLSPYVAVESSRTKNNAYYWENRLLLGGGVRFTPSLVRGTGQAQSALTRFVVYAEYLNSAKYYGVSAPSSIPRFEIRVGISLSVGRWYR